MRSFDSSLFSFASFVIWWWTVVTTMMMTTQAWAPGSIIAPYYCPQLPPPARTRLWSLEATICRQKQASSSFFQLASSLNDDNSGNDTSGDDDCEDECDIDWDAMPVWEEENVQQTQQAAAAAASVRSAPSPETLRLRLEMAWQQDEAAEDCDIEQPVTCGSEPCNTCRGRGWSNCRFCHGSMLLRNSHATISMNGGGGTGSDAISTTATVTRTRTKWSLPCDTFTPCRICNQGVETCSSCKGSGWVAGWTQLPNEQQQQNDEDDSSRYRRLFP